MDKLTTTSTNRNFVKKSIIVITCLGLFVITSSFFILTACQAKSVYEYDTESFLADYNNSENVQKYEYTAKVANLKQKEAIPFLKDVLANGDDMLKAAAISALGNSQAKNEVPLLRKYLSDNNSLIRLLSAQALLKVDDNSGVKILLEALENSEPYCSDMPLILEALSLNDSELTIQGLINFISNERCGKTYEGEALISLGKIQGQLPAAFLINYLDNISKNDINRTYAIRAIGYNGHPIAISYLKNIVNDNNEKRFNKELIKAILERQQ
jgi:HEAT repeat protein